MSEKAKFTQGPWKARQGRDTNWWFVIEDSEGMELGSGDGGFEEPEAHLIAAAPELYEALDELANGYAGNRFDVGLSQRIEKAIAALAKARGES